MSIAERKFPLLDITTPETLLNCRNLTPVHNSGTIFIASYPKSGTTWMQAIVYHLLSKNDGDLSHISDYSPFYENCRTWDNGKIKDKYATNHAKLGYSVFNTHLLPDMLPVSSVSSPPIYCIYLTRRGKDVATSFYHHLSHQIEENGKVAFGGTFDSFFGEWCNGNLPFGRWVDHMQSWRDAAEVRNILYISYEELQHDMMNCLLRISEFLHLPCDTALLENVARQVNFTTMKQHMHLYQPVSVQWKDNFQFIRKGIIGDSAAHFTSELEELYHSMLVDAYPEGTPKWLADLI